MDEDRGSAPVEFVFGGLFLLVPLVYLILALAQLQNAALGTEATARFVARTIASGEHVPPEFVRDTIAESYGLESESLTLTIECVPQADACPEPGTTIVVTVSDTVPLPLMPETFGASEPVGIPVEATSTYRVERLAG